MSSGARPMVEIEHLGKNFGTETAIEDVCLSVADGEFVTLLGPSGCGKTTTLRCIAGLERPDTGEIRIAGETVASAERGVHLNPEQRNIGMVFQSYAVWPHMTVFENVAYGLRVRRVPAGEIKAKTMRALELVGLAHLAARYATKLSGGQRQRVALARAIVYEPRVVLFDEPLSNLDAKLREQMRDELVRLQKEVGITSIYVTHDQSEALVMSDRVVVMDRAVIQQVGDPRTIYSEPANTFVAGFIGAANLMEGRLVSNEGAHCVVEIGCRDGSGSMRVSARKVPGMPVGARVFINIRPEDLVLHVARPQGNDNSILSGEIIDTVYLGSFLDCRVSIRGYEMAVQINHFENLTPGQPVYLTVEPDHVLCLAN